MVNSVNPSASKLLEQIKRLSAPTTQKKTNHLDFKKDALNNHSHNIHLLNSGNIQKKNEASNLPTDDIKKELAGKNIQMLERSRAVCSETVLLKEPVGSFLDIYL